MTSALVFVCASFLVGCAWGEGSPDEDGTGGGVDAAVASAVCGDSVCAASEVGSCTSDCGSGGGNTNPVCGNSTCETGETQASCPNDCGGGGGATCGNGTCDAASGETSTSCPADCMGGGAACPADPNECLFCSIIGQMCPAGHDMASCAACAPLPI